MDAYEQVCNLVDGQELSSGVTSVICLVMQRGLMVAGFGKNNEPLTIHYNGYTRKRPVWELSFFEQLFATDPLLADKSKVKGVFPLPGRQLIVPDELFEKREAEKWLTKLYLVEPSDAVQIYPFKEIKAQFIYALPVNITELIRINFPKGTVVPTQLCQQRVPYSGHMLQCLITAEQACASLHSGGKLLWQQIFNYANCEDIAYILSQICAEHKLTPAQLTLRCTATSAAEFAIINGLSQYFPNIASGGGDSFVNNWDGAIILAQQLLSCVL